jgi:carbamoylphosphate synthase large subunit
MNNILFTSAGRRVELVQQFIKARNEYSKSSRIVSADMNSLAPALYFADAFYTVPAIKDPQYIPKLLEICEKEKIRLIIPTIDTELHKLSSNRHLFNSIGTDVLVSSIETLIISENKLNTFRFFKSLNLKTPESYGQGMPHRGSFPSFIKPISGSSSINTFKVNNEKELEFFEDYIGDYLIQEFIDGEEYTIDVFCDFEGNPIFITPRIRLAVRSGEVLKTQIKHDEQLEMQVIKIISKLKPNGPLTIQAIKNKIDDQFYFIEINARFGGGSPLSMKAGANSAYALFTLLKGERKDFKLNAAKDRLVFLRFDQSIILKQKAEGCYEKY